MTREDFFVQTSQRKTIDIGDGLIMRWSTKADTENVIALLMNAFKWLPIGDPLPDGEIPGPNEFVGAAGRRILSGKSGTMSEFDYALVEDTKKEKGKNPIVACISLQRIKAYYGSIILNFGKPELIATEPSYRNRGLIRKLMFEMIHPESEARGDVLQLIPGIRHFYRQFGYEYGFACHTGATLESPNVIPSLEKDKSEPFALKVATLDDIDFLVNSSTPEKLHITSLSIHRAYTPEYWRYIVHDAYQDIQNRWDADRDTHIIIDEKTGQKVGFTVMSHHFFGSQVEAFALEVNLASFVDVKDSALRQLFEVSKNRQEVNKKNYEEFKKNKEQKSEKSKKSVTNVSIDEAAAPTGAETAAIAPNPKPVSMTLNLPEVHPLCVLLGDKAKRGGSLGFRIYARIYSYPRFIKAIAPELEARLAKSPLAGLTGRLRINYFRKVEGSSGKGTEVFIEKGRIVDAKEWAKPSQEEDLEERLRWKKEGNAPTLYCADFAPLTFTNLITGKDSLQDLIWAYGENGVQNDATRLLLNTLFPKSLHRFDIFDW
ncbi:hypothetical protein BGZ76_003609 [Entomortierella beljakovae]|nr:hypothetical protein BGZ76_003609 [Entomortierella beljakovae]